MLDQEARKANGGYRGEYARVIEEGTVLMALHLESIAWTLKSPARGIRGVDVSGCLVEDHA